MKSSQNVVRISTDLNVFTCSSILSYWDSYGSCYSHIFSLYTLLIWKWSKLCHPSARFPLFPLPRSLVLFYLLFKGISHSYCETSSNIRSRLYRHSVLLRLFLFLLFSSHELLPEYASALRSWERHKTPLEYSSKTYIRTARESSLGVWSIKYVCASHFSLKYANCEQHKPATFPAYGNFRRAHIDIQKSFQLQKHSKIGLCQYGVRAIRWHY